MTGKPSPVEHKISVFKLMMISTAFIISIRNFPIMAEMGLHLVFFTLIAAVLYLIPVALVSAELATGWPQRGGRTCLGERGLWRTMGISCHLAAVGTDVICRGGHTFLYCRFPCLCV